MKSETCSIKEAPGDHSRIKYRVSPDVSPGPLPYPAYNCDPVSVSETVSHGVL